MTKAIVGLPPEFPVDLDGVGELHAAFFDESRTRGRWWHPVAGNPGRPSCSAHVRFVEGHPSQDLRPWLGIKIRQLPHQSNLARCG
jgi:hypothetical protein